MSLISSNENMNVKFEIPGPQLLWVIEPENRIRFRYASEGGSHGGLAGKGGKKRYPTLKLINYHGRKKVFVRVRLFTEDEKEHVLQFKGKKDEGSKYCIEEKVQDNEVVFKNLQILSKKKDEIEEILMERRLSNLKDDMSQPVREHFEKTYRKDIKERARAILNSVKLYFEAFENDRPNQPLCSLFSDVISNQKAAAKGDLRICRLSQIVGSSRGGDEIILLCEKVQKDNIKVKFFETDRNGSVVWYDYGSFSPVDVHHQVAITFKTPPYAHNVEKTVFICLERNGEESDAREFTYKPEGPSSKKRKLETYQPAVLENVESSENSISSMSMSSPEACANGTCSEMQNMSNEPLDDLRLFADDIPVEIIECMDFFNGSENTGEYELFPDLVNPLDNGTHSTFNLDSMCDGITSYDKIDGRKAFMNTERIHTQNLDIDTVLSCLTLEDRYVHKSKYLDKYKREFELTCDLKQKKKNCFDFLLKKDKYDNTLLHIAVLLNRNLEPILKICHIAKIDLINVQNCRKQTALHFAAEKNNIKAAQILLANFSNPNLKDANGNTCYHIAAKNNSPELLQAINAYSQFSYEVDFNDQGLTPLHIAIMQKQSFCVFECLKIYLTNSNIVEKKAGRSLLHYAVDFQPSLLPRLLELPEIDVNMQDFEGNTPLHIACARENIESIKQLLKSGANPLIKNFKQNCNSLEEESSEDDISEGQLPSELTTNIKENLEEDISEGQLPSELTTNIKILELFRDASTIKAIRETEGKLPLDQHISGGSQESDKKTVQVTEKLCEYLDENMKWKQLALIFLEPHVIDGLSLSLSPAKALLNYIKKEEKDKFLERLQIYAEFADLSCVLSIIKEHS